MSLLDLFQSSIVFFWPNATRSTQRLIAPGHAIACSARFFHSRASEDDSRDCCLPAKAKSCFRRSQRSEL